MSAHGRKPAAAFAIGLAALAVGFAGCGDEDDPEPAAPSSAGTAEEHSSADPAESEIGPAEIPPPGEDAPTPTEPETSGGTEAGSGGPSYASFQTPTGNIGCAGDEAGMRCDISEYSYEPPHKPKSCELDWGGAVSVGGEFPGQVVCAGDTVLNPDAPVLEYGQANTVGNIACESSEAGIRCESTVTGHGFFLSAQQVEVF